MLQSITFACSNLCLVCVRYVFFVIEQKSNTTAPKMISFRERRATISSWGFDIMSGEVAVVQVTAAIPKAKWSNEVSDYHIFARLFALRSMEQPM